MNKFKQAMEERKQRMAAQREAAKARLQEVVDGFRGWVKLTHFMREFDKNCPTVKAMVAEFPELEIRPHGRYGFIIGRK